MSMVLQGSCFITDVADSHSERHWEITHWLPSKKNVTDHQCPASFSLFCICTNAGHYCEIVPSEQLCSLLSSRWSCWWGCSILDCCHIDAHFTYTHLIEYVGSPTAIYLINKILRIQGFHHNYHQQVYWKGSNNWSGVHRRVQFNGV